jgi:hypothetical protein
MSTIGGRPNKELQLTKPAPAEPRSFAAEPVLGGPEDAGVGDGMTVRPRVDAERRFLQEQSTLGPCRR